MCSDILCMHKKTFQSLDKSDYQCPQCESMYQVRNIAFEQQTNSIFFEVWSRDLYFRRRKSQFKMLFEMCIAQHAQTESVFTFQPTKILVFTTVESAKAALTC